ncbi:MAG: hypothetical protein ACE5JI_00645 [Acidobacteriota bacterium]
MLRLRHLAVSSVVVCLVACEGPEQSLLNRFFTAVQQGNEDAVAAMSLASFPGEVQSWEVVEVGAESSEAFRLAELRREAADAKGDLDFQLEKNALFLQDNQSTYDRYKARHDKDPDYEFKGKLAEFQEEWEKRLKQQRALERKAEETNEAAKKERQAARMSINQGVTDSLSGDVVTKEVTVKVNDGSADKIYVFTLRRYKLVDRERNITPMTRWIIADIQERGV